MRTSKPSRLNWESAAGDIVAGAGEIPLWQWAAAENAAGGTWRSIASTIGDVTADAVAKAVRPRMIAAAGDGGRQQQRTRPKPMPEEKPERDAHTTDGGGSQVVTPQTETAHERDAHATDGAEDDAVKRQATALPTLVEIKLMDTGGLDGIPMAVIQEYLQVTGQVDCVRGFALARSVDAVGGAATAAMLLLDEMDN